MADKTDIEGLKIAYQTWHDTKGEGDRAKDAWLDLFDDHIHIVSMGDATAAISFARQRHSKLEAVEYFLDLLKEWKMVHWTPETFVHEGDHVAMFGRCAWTNRRTQKTIDCHIAHLWAFRDGKAVRFTEIFDSAKAVAAATPGA